MQVHLQQNLKHPEGFTVAFPYNPMHVDQVKKVLGVAWDKKLKVWTSEGPEILLDFQRFSVEIAWMSTEARAVAEAFRQQLWDVMDLRSLDYDIEEYGYQRQGAAILAAMPDMILADEMGLGKTKQSLDAYVKRNSHAGLVLCPKTLTFNWKKEVEKWHPELTVGVLPDNAKDEKRKGISYPGRATFWASPTDIVIANYEKLQRSDWPYEINWDVVIPDEATRLKNSSTITWHAVEKIARRAQAVWPLTGTPLEIRLTELYNIMKLIRPAVFGNYMRFRDQHLICDWSGTVIGAKNIDLLRDRLAPFMLRRTKKEVLKQLPEKLPPQNEYIKMSVAEENDYLTMTSAFKNWLSERGVSGGGDPLVQTLRMRQYCCTPQIWGSDLPRGSKFERLEEIIEDWEGKIVVFTYFKEAANLLHTWLGCHPRAFISGDTETDDGERIKRANDFNDGKLGKVFVSTDAGGTGIDLIGADLIIHFDQGNFNPQRLHQREDRLHRIGQLNRVHVINMLYMDSIDVGQQQLYQEEEALFDSVIEGAEQAILRKLDAPRWRRLIEGRLN